MSKQKQPRRLADNQAIATLRSVRTSAQKARLVLDMIRGQSVDKALADLTFSKKKIAKDVKALLQSAIANAENNHNLNVDKLVVERASADKSFVMKRFHARARGRGARILKPTCHMTVVVAEQHAQANEG
jgi:large subunit ribosomal protein L22